MKLTRALLSTTYLVLVLALGGSNTFHALLVGAAVTNVGPFPDGVPGSGYGCENMCDSGDVTYVIRVKIKTYVLPGSGNNPDVSALSDGEDVSTLVRTFEGDREASSASFCQNDDDGTGGPLGPCLTVNPGQTITVKLINELDDGMKIMNQTKTSIESYWYNAETNDLDDIKYFGKVPASPAGMKIPERQDLPGWDATFDDTNIHFHGMQVVPHLFYPQGTGNPNAKWISTSPASEDPDHKCFCYVISVPEDHPEGTFFYHTHRHSSVAMQNWGGMVGLVQVGSLDTNTSPDAELAEQGITRDEPLLFWEWIFLPNAKLPAEYASSETPLTLLQGGFNAANTQVFLVNNEYQPVISACVGETIHFRMVCGQTTTGSIVYIEDPDGESITFYVFAADGISFDRAYPKKSVTIGVGQREAVLVQFSKPGSYKIMQFPVNDFEGSNLPLDFVEAAYIEVDGGCEEDPVDLSSLVFTPGMGTKGIDLDEIEGQQTVNFQVGSRLDVAPVPQFNLDGKLFDYKHIAHTVRATSAQQWTLTSNMNYFHPFHIHVNPFLMVDVWCPSDLGVLPTGETLFESVNSTQMEPPRMWRDTVFLPPFGGASVYQKFGGDATAYSGKTVYHCHFLDREDQGMIAAFIIGSEDYKTDDAVLASDLDEEEQHNDGGYDDDDGGDIYHGGEGDISGDGAGDDYSPGNDDQNL